MDNFIYTDFKFNDELYRPVENFLNKFRRMNE